MSINELITVVIPVKNEERNLPDCLENIRHINNVLIVDSDSTDGTCRVAADFGREVVQFHWNGHFPKKRNWILQNYKFKTPWVMFLDADEIPGPDFWTEAESVLPGATHDVFVIYLYNWFMGRILRHGDMARKTAIVRVGKGEYERIEESNWSALDMEIHEHLCTEGTLGEIKTPIEHHDRRSLKSYLSKHNEYSSWEVGRYLNVLDRSRLTKRQRLKYAIIRNPLTPLAYFLYSYVVRMGFLDGKQGYYFAALKLCQCVHIQAKILEYLSESTNFSINLDRKS